MNLTSLYQLPKEFGNPDLTLRDLRTLRFWTVVRGKKLCAGFCFNGVGAIQIRSGKCFEEWQDDTYYELAEVIGSPWKEQVLNAAGEEYSWYRTKHHYAISDDSYCYEFIADSWELLPAEEWQETP
jgi:hypothetical protein